MIPSFDDMFVKIQNKILEFYPESKLDFRHFKRENFYEIRYYDKDLVVNQAFQKYIYEECCNWLYDKGITNYCINYRTKKIKPRKSEVVEPVWDFSDEKVEIYKCDYDYFNEQITYMNESLIKLGKTFMDKMKLLIKGHGDTSQLKAEIKQIYETINLFVSEDNPKRDTINQFYKRYIDIDK